MKNTFKKSGVPMAILLLIGLSITVAQAQTITNLITDDFSGAASTAVNSSGRTLVNPGSPSTGATVWNISNSVVPTLDGSGLVNWAGSGGFGTSSISAPLPTASSTSTNSSLYFTQMTLTNLTVSSLGGAGYDLGIGTGSNAITLDTANSSLLSGDPGVFIGNGSSNRGYAFTTVPRTPAGVSGTWVIDWYTDKVQVYLNSSLVFDSTGSTATYNPGALALPTGTVAGPQALSQGGAQMTLDGLSFDQVYAVPEPSTLALGGIGFAAFFFLRRRKLPA